jgi:precorrin-2 dehydrogenase/sirohydrochlorin ferrochelatase
MDAFPAFFPLAGRTVVIAGSGEAALAKLRLFEGSPARVLRLEGASALRPEAYSGACLAFVADDDTAFALAAARAARAAHVPVNVVDRPQECDFTTPALVDRGAVVAAIGTAGASPMLATLLRNDLETRLPAGAGAVAVLFSRLQDEVRQALPQLHERRAFLRAQLAGPAARAAQDGDMASAEDLLRAALVGGAPGRGGVVYVTGTGPADLLTLRAARALAAADLLAPDLGADPGVLDLARRDAPRLSPQEAGPDRLIALAREGQVVARVLVAPVTTAERTALSAAGIEVHTPPAAPGP